MHCPICNTQSVFIKKIQYGYSSEKDLRNLLYCSNCHHWHLQEKPDIRSFDFKNFYSGTPPPKINFIADKFDRKHMQNIARLYLLQAFHEIKADDCILEIGPGYYSLLLELQRAGYQNKMGAFEPSKDASALLNEYGVKILGDALSEDIISKISNRFSIGIINQVLYYLEDPLSYLKMFNRVLKNNAIVLIEVANDELLLNNELESTTHINLFSIKSLVECLSRAGFDILFVNTCGETIEGMKGDYYSNPEFTGHFTPKINRKINSLLSHVDLRFNRCFSPELAVSRNPEAKYGGENRFNIRIIARKRDLPTTQQ